MNLPLTDPGLFLVALFAGLALGCAIVAAVEAVRR